MLKETLDIADEILGKVAGPWAELLFAKPLRGDIQKSWPSVKKDLDSLKMRIAAASGTSAKDIAAHGMVGPSLRPKHTGVTQASEAFKIGGTRGGLSKVLGWLGIVIPSIPGG